MDGFPFDRDHWATMIDQELLPDSVVTLTDEDATADYLLTRFTQMNGLPDPSTFKGKKKPETGNEVRLYVHVHAKRNGTTVNGFGNVF